MTFRGVGRKRSQVQAQLFPVFFLYWVVGKIREPADLKLSKYSERMILAVLCGVISSLGAKMPISRLIENLRRFCPGTQTTKLVGTTKQYKFDIKRSPSALKCLSIITTFDGGLVFQTIWQPGKKQNTAAKSFGRPEYFCGLQILCSTSPKSLTNNIETGFL